MTGRAPPRLFCFGLGYSARALAARLLDAGWRVAGTSRGGSGDDADPRIPLHAFDRGRPLDDAAAALDGVTHVLSSVPPDGDGDAVLDHHGDHLAALGTLTWAGYLSTTGVYGDTGGARVDETSPLRPTSDRSRRRVDAERAWLALHHSHGLPVHLFRLAGIYGPGRSALDQLQSGRARRIDRPGHRFSRIHVDDIASVLQASMARPRAGAVYNVADDEPAPPADVTAFAAGLLQVAPPPLVPFEEARRDMSAMALSFWNDNRLVDNRLIHDELSVDLAYPSYREGLRAVRQAGG